MSNNLKLKQIQIHKKISNKEFAKHLSITEEKLNELLTGKTTFPTELAITLEKDGYTLKYIIFGSVSNNLEKETEKSFIEYELLNSYRVKHPEIVELLDNCTCEQQLNVKDFISCFISPYDKPIKIDLEKMTKLCLNKYDFFKYIVDKLDLENITNERNNYSQSNINTFDHIIGKVLFYGSTNNNFYGIKINKNKYDLRFLNLISDHSFADEILASYRYGYLEWNKKHILELINLGYKFKSINPFQQYQESGYSDLVDDIALTITIKSLCDE